MSCAHLLAFVGLGHFKNFWGWPQIEWGGKVFDGEAGIWETNQIPCSAQAGCDNCLVGDPQSLTRSAFIPWWGARVGKLWVCVQDGKSLSWPQREWISSGPKNYFLDTSWTVTTHLWISVFPISCGFELSLKLFKDQWQTLTLRLKLDV